jgi:exopolyphosphatase/guanosine-5'-triphosphate,3'-diphosphate pyrophosphatase
MPHPLLAAMDLGSNTFRLILAEKGENGLVPGTKRVFQEIPRLSEGLIAGGALGAVPRQRALEALERFASTLSALGNIPVLAGATMAVRLASDGKEFLSHISSRFGWKAMLLSGEEEAFLSAQGVISGLSPLPPSSIVFDIGGRSTEFVLLEGKKTIYSQSLPLGVVGLTEAFISSDPPQPSELKKLRDEVLKALQSLSLPEGGPKRALVGTAGTVTTIAAMLLSLPEYSPEVVNNSVLPQERVEELYRTLIEEPLSLRKKRAGLPSMRADVIPAGLALVLTILDHFGNDHLIVSDNGLLEGIWSLHAGLLSLPHKPPGTRAS